MRAALDQRAPTDATHGDDIDLDAARRWAWTMRRIDDVEFSDDSDLATIHGVGHRLPVSRRVPARVGRGLVALGYPATRRQGS